MTGYNHYPNCMCGWCVNHRGGQLVIAVRESLPRRDAIAFLKRNSAASISACYVDPNSWCPVCRAPVFFYSNQFGSKVYFDALGPPWPKHPCTDSPRFKRMGVSKEVRSPERRAIGLTKELVEAAGTAGLVAEAAVNPKSAGWVLFIVVEVSSRGPERRVKLESLSGKAGATVQFRYFSDEEVLAAGDFVSERNGQFSFVYRLTMEPVVLRDGDRLPNPNVEVGGSNTKKEAPTTVGPAKGPKPPRPPDQSLPKSKFDMTKDEMVHFHSKTLSVDKLCDRLAPIVKRYARDDIRKPREVAVRLNTDKYRTANGSSWTTRLTFFLLALIFEEPATAGKPGQLSGGPDAKSPRPRGSVRGSDDPLSPEELVRLLSGLGRVTRKDS